MLDIQNELEKWEKGILIREIQYNEQNQMIDSIEVKSIYNISYFDRNIYDWNFFSLIIRKVFGNLYIYKIYWDFD